MLIERSKDNYWSLNKLDIYMVGHKGAICGGCFKNIFNHEKVKDLDVFFKCEEDYMQAVKWFGSQTTGYSGGDKQPEKYQFYYQNNNVTAYKDLQNGIVIELCKKIYGSPEKILKNFDFTITKFAYFKKEIEEEGETHIEYRVLFESNFFEHLHQKRIVIDDNIPYPMSTFERMIRYAKYGYYPCRETKLKIVEALRTMPENQVKSTKSLYDGLD